MSYMEYLQDIENQLIQQPVTQHRRYYLYIENKKICLTHIKQDPLLSFPLGILSWYDRTNGPTDQKWNVIFANLARYCKKEHLL